MLTAFSVYICLRSVLNFGFSKVKVQKLCRLTFYFQNIFMKKNIFIAIAAVLILGCSPKEYKAIILPETEYRELDTLEVTAPRLEAGEDGAEADPMPAIYNPSARRLSDLLHTRLEVRFDWQKEQVLGKATLTLKPYFYPTSSVTLDAKGFEFHKVTFEGSNAPLAYTYDGKQIAVQLGREYTRNESYKLYLEYTASPTASGGSAAITSDKGLFFINPRGDNPHKPQQIWTQGETENNSRWFPTIDKPNERATNEIYITVENRFKTLSNGLLLSSVINADGTRTDHWKMDLPHAPYLVMMAVGEYAVVRDTWNHIPVEYYVEPKYENYARKIFPHTPEMLQLFSDKLGLSYPWQKYSQVVVRDYVSGAMENTTAVIFGEFMNGTDKDLVDNLQNDKIVAHEMFHHWFGDYVTCESWANLTMNEGFANYSEYLWLEHKYGREEADLHRLQEQEGYLQSAREGIHPLIHFGYEDKEQMFDAHSYNKGGLVLHMLRNYVGEDAFFAALNKYLQDNAFTDVEGHELRLAFEDVTGEDLNWFFNQWFYSEGHPSLEVECDYDEERRQVVVRVNQTQDPREMPAVFELPVTIDLYTGDSVSRHTVRINQRSQTFSIDLPKEPELILFDADGVLLAEVQEEKSMEEYAFQFRHAKNVVHRLEAFSKLMSQEEAGQAVQEALEQAMGDKLWLFRLLAVENADMENPKIVARVEKMLESDPHADVRLSALDRIAETQNEKYGKAIRRVVARDPAMRVISAGLGALAELSPQEALEIADSLRSEDAEGLVLAVSGIYASIGNPANLSYFEEKINKISGYALYAFLQNYAALAVKGDAASMLATAERMRKISMDSSKLFWMRYLATKTINDLHAALSEQARAADTAEKKELLRQKDLELVKVIQEIKAWETDARVLGIYESFPNPPLNP
jgi:aminopeptidase N